MAPGPTAGFAHTALGVEPETLGRLGNLSAMTRITVNGAPTNPFALSLDPPVEPSTHALPSSLHEHMETRRNRSQIADDDPTSSDPA